MSKLHVLIIEDDRDTAELFATVLGLVGFECEIVLSAREALTRLAATVPDLILLDMRLGQGLGGEDILYQIRSNPRLDQARVIVITAYPSMAAPVTNLADLILLKPVEVDQLKTLVQRLGSFESKPKHLLFRDPVTGLFNREFYLTRLEHAFERSRRRPDFLYAAVVLLLRPADRHESQVDSESLVNLLRQIADRLRRNLRPTDTIARFSGWTFALLCEDLKKPEDVRVIVERIARLVSEPCSLSGSAFKLLASFGAALPRGDFEDPEAILQAAEQALAQARATDELVVYDLG